VTTDVRPRCPGRRLVAFALPSSQATSYIDFVTAPSTDRAAHRAWLVGLTGELGRGLVVDLGCGRGEDLLLLAARHSGADVRFVGVDSSDQAVAVASKAPRRTASNRMLMNQKILITALALTLGCRQEHPPQSVRLVAVIESIHADSAGRAMQAGRPLTTGSLDSLLTRLEHQKGATIWFSWSGGPLRPRNEAQERLLTHLRASGARVELRSDSTSYSRVLRS
jgi:SAM-dependent methyltransferase